MKFSDYHLSEAIFYYVFDNPEVYFDSRDLGLSLAEYIDAYKREQFKTYALDKYNILVEYDTEAHRGS